LDFTASKAVVERFAALMLYTVYHLFSNMEKNVIGDRDSGQRKMGCLNGGRVKIWF
jgi:hypothetical protein